MPFRLLRLGAPLALLVVAGCDSVDCEGVQPCRDGIALRLSSAVGFTDDGTFYRTISPRPGDYHLTVAAGHFQDACAFSISAESPANEAELLSANSCEGRLRIEANSVAFEVVVEYPLLDAPEIDVAVVRDGETVGATSAPIVYAQPSPFATACRVETCQQAGINVPVE